MRNVSKRIKSWNIPVWHASFHLLPAHSSLDPFPTLSPLLLYLYHFNHLAMCLVPLTSPAARSTSRNTNTHTHTEGGFQTHTQTPQISVLSLPIIHPPVSHCTLKLCAIWTALNPVHICYTVLTHLPLGCWSHTLSHWLFIIIIIAIIMRAL